MLPAKCESECFYVRGFHVSPRSFALAPAVLAMAFKAIAVALALLHRPTRLKGSCSTLTKGYHILCNTMVAMLACGCWKRTHCSWVLYDRNAPSLPELHVFHRLLQLLTPLNRSKKAFNVESPSFTPSNLSKKPTFSSQALSAAPFTPRGNSGMALNRCPCPRTSDSCFPQRDPRQHPCSTMGNSPAFLTQQRYPSSLPKTTA